MNNAKAKEQKKSKCDTPRMKDSGRPGVVAGACNPASRRPGPVDGLRRRVLIGVGACRPSVHTKLGVNKATSEESGMTWLSKEGRTGSGPTGSRQKSPRRDSGGTALANASRRTAPSIESDPFLFAPSSLPAPLTKNTLGALRIVYSELFRNF